jgi:hypothetical protein
MGRRWPKASPSRTTHGAAALAAVALGLAAVTLHLAAAPDGAVGAKPGAIFTAELEAFDDREEVPVSAALTVGLRGSDKSDYPGQYVPAYLSEVEIRLGPRLVLNSEGPTCSAARLLAPPPAGGPRACASAQVGDGVIRYEPLAPYVFGGSLASVRIYNARIGGAPALLLLLKPTGEAHGPAVEITPRVLEADLMPAQPGAGPSIEIGFPKPERNGFAYRAVELTLGPGLRVGGRAPGFLSARCPATHRPIRLARLALTFFGFRGAKTMMGPCG